MDSLRDIQNNAEKKMLLDLEKEMRKISKKIEEFEET